MSVDDLIQEVAARGLRLNNLYQLVNGRWQANITDGEKFWDFGRGDDAVSALQAALHISATTTPEESIKQDSVVLRRIRPQKATEEDLKEIGSL